MYPDYTNPKTAEWWIQMCMEFKNILDYDGIWIVSLNLLFNVFLPLVEMLNVHPLLFYSLYSKLKLKFPLSYFLITSALTVLRHHWRGEQLPVIVAASCLLA